MTSLLLPQQDVARGVIDQLLLAGRRRPALLLGQEKKNPFIKSAGLYSPAKMVCLRVMVEDYQDG